MLSPGQPPAARKAPPVAATTNKETTRSLNRTTAVPNMVRHLLLAGIIFPLCAVRAVSAFACSDKSDMDIYFFFPAGLCLLAKIVTGIISEHKNL
jgi:hypothetical protein